jgi:hypothetical protein
MRQQEPPRRTFASYTQEFLETGAKAAVAVKSGIELAETILPYLTPLVLAV